MSFDQNKGHKFNRREFLKKAAAIGLGATVGEFNAKMRLESLSVGKSPPLTGSCISWSLKQICVMPWNVTS